MFRKFVTSTTVALALICAGATPASAQNPFDIDGTITDADNSGVAGAAKAIDPNANAKELGPAQGTATKFFQIETAAVPMLAETNPNPGTDYNAVWTQTKKAVNGDFWFYFAWHKDNDTGSGFVSMEAHQAANTCDSNSDNIYSPAELLACNPWTPRTFGDFAFFWDQSGSGFNIYLRKWTDGSPDAFIPGQPGLLLNTLVDGQGQPVVQAVYGVGNDRSRGELALNLSGLNLIAPGSCQGFANLIPMSITGNSSGDQADVKDAVLAPISIDICGVLTVTKVTLDPSGAALADTTSVFDYAIGGAATINDTIKGCTASGTLASCNGPVDTHSNLSPGTFTLTEGTPLPGKYGFVKIVCGGTQIANGGNFVLLESETVACTITNQIPFGSPTLTTLPTVRALFYDTLTVDLENALPDNTQVSGVTIQLFADSACEASPQGDARTLTMTFANGLHGVVSTVPLLSGTTISPAYLIVNTNTPYYWKVVYPGDSQNDPGEACGELTSFSYSAAAQ